MSKIQLGCLSDSNTISQYLKTSLLLCGLFGTFMLAGCDKEEYYEYYKGSTVGLILHDHHPEKHVDYVSVNDGARARDGIFTCCVKLPEKWKPGMTANVEWKVLMKDDPNDANFEEKAVKKSAVVEIQRYTKEEMGSIHVHIYPGDKVKIVVTNWNFGSPFYPLLRADWGTGKKVDNFAIWRYCQNPKYFDLSGVVTPRDYEWAKQWGMENGKCTDPAYLEWASNLPALLEESVRKSFDFHTVEYSPEQKQILWGVVQHSRVSGKFKDERSNPQQEQTK